MTNQMKVSQEIVLESVISEEDEGILSTAGQLDEEPNIMEKHEGPAIILSNSELSVRKQLESLNSENYNP